MLDRFRSRNNALSDEAIQWIVRLDATPDAGDRSAFDAWCRRSPAHAEAARHAHALLEDIGHGALAEEHRHWTQALTPPPRMLSRRAVLAGGLSAAALAGVGGTGLLGPASGLFAEHSTRIGQRRQIALGGGSTVWLNSESACSHSFSSAWRRLTLAAGELLVDVVEDLQRPFVIESRDGRIRVGSGRYALRREARRSLLTVVAGRAEISSRSGGQATLAANQRVVFNADVMGSVDTVDADALTAWVRGKLIFNRQRLAAIAGELERYVPGRIVVMGDALRQLQLSGVFELDDGDALLRNVAALAGAEIVRLPLLTVLR